MKLQRKPLLYEQIKSLKQTPIINRPLMKRNNMVIDNACNNHWHYLEQTVLLFCSKNLSRSSALFVLKKQGPIFVKLFYQQ